MNKHHVRARRPKTEPVKFPRLVHAQKSEVPEMVNNFVAKEENRIQESIIEQLSQRLSNMSVQQEQHIANSKMHAGIVQELEDRIVYWKNRHEEDTLQLQEKVFALEENKINTSDILAMNDREIQQLKKAMVCKDSRNQKVAAEENRKQLAVAKHKSQQQIKQLELELKDSSQQKQLQERDMGIFQKENKTLKAELEALQQQLKAARQCNTKIQHDFVLESEHRVKAENNCEMLVTQVEDIKKDWGTLRKMVEDDDIVKQNFKIEVAMLREKIGHLENEKAQDAQQMESIKSKYKQYQTQARVNRTKMESMQEKMLESAAKTKELEQEIQNWKKKYSESIAMSKSTNEKRKFLEKIIDHQLKVPVGTSAVESNNNMSIPDASRMEDSDAPNWMRY